MNGIQTLSLDNILNLQNKIQYNFDTLPLNNTKGSRLSPHFKMQEFLCKCSECNGEKDIPKGYVKNLKPIILKLEILRLTLKTPIIITSGYRCPQHPRSKKNPLSLHTMGHAVDFTYKNICFDCFTLLRVLCDFRGIGWYPQEKFFHVDSRESHAFWILLKEDEYMDL